MQRAVNEMNCVRNEQRRMRLLLQQICFAPPDSSTQTRGREDLGGRQRLDPRDTLLVSFQFFSQHRFRPK